MPRRTLLALAAVVALAAPSSGDDAPANPLESAKVGQWVRYKLPQDLEQKLTVTKIDGKKVTVKAETILSGSVVASSTTVTDLAVKAPARADDAKVEATTLEIKGKKRKCRLETTATGKTWTCPDVPVTGIVKIESNGAVIQELIDWGEPAPAKEKP